MASAKPINITLTTAGLNEIINAEQNGTAPVQLQTVKFSDVHQEISQATTELTNVVATISTISGDSVGDGMIHITVRDVSQEAYTVKAFGIYTDKGTLFGVYSQAEPILQKVGVSIAELAIDFQIHGAQPTSVTFGDVSFLNPPATTEREGVAKIATLTDMQEGLSGNTIVTPAVLAQYLTTDLGINPETMADFASKSKANTFKEDQIVEKALTVRGNAVFTAASFSGATSFSGAASFSSGSFKVSPTAPTPADSDDSTKVATTAFVKRNTTTALGDYAAKNKANTFLEGQVINKTLTVKGASAFAGASFSASPTAPTPAANDNTTKLATTAFVKAAVNAVKDDASVPTGSFVHFAGTAIPPGFLLCNGAAVSRTTYANLFKVIGTKYGQGDGKTTFTLPDLRDRFLEGSTVAGNRKNAGLPNITGSLLAKGNEFVRSVATGALINKEDKTTLSNGHTPNNYPNLKIEFDASKSNNIYKTSNTVQPASLSSLILIKI